MHAYLPASSIPELVEIVADKPMLDGPARDLPVGGTGTPTFDASINGTDRSIKRYRMPIRCP